MVRPLTIALAALAVAGLPLVASAPARGQQADDELSKVKELELEEVREKISALKTSMDRRAAERDRITAKLPAQPSPEPPTSTARVWLVVGVAEVA